MAGYAKRTTQAYELGRTLSRQTRHLVLATATPHKGDPENFLKLLQLLDPGIHEAGIVQYGGHAVNGNTLMSRRLKEEMVGFHGEPLFKPRVVETRWHTIGDNPAEMALYTDLTDYVNKTYRAAEKIGGLVRVNVQFAMTILQRRMASSLAALERSLIRRRDALVKAETATVSQSALLYDEDAPEYDRWQIEAAKETASPARTLEQQVKEIAELDRLLKHVDAVRATGHETKVAKLEETLREAGVEPGNEEKVLVFTEFKDTLDFVRGLFQEWGYAVTQIDGFMPHNLRRRAEKDFADDWCQVMVATEAAGEGINLQFCARMVNYDLPWVPTRLEQRMGRIHRYGQKRVARIYNLVAGDTREGHVLRGLLERLDTMREQMGDRVFDVVSTLVADVDMEGLLTKVALAPTTDASHYEVLDQLIAATRETERRLAEWSGHPQPLQPAKYEELRQASRQFRLTPEYAQHFFVDALQEMKETPEALGNGEKQSGDADRLSVQVLRWSVARSLGVRQGERLRLTFQQDVARDDWEVRLVTLGGELFDGLLDRASAEWGKTLALGAVFLDLDLPPGDGYLLWFLKAQVLDGNALPVTDALLAVRQTTDSLGAVPASQLIDLVPSTESLQVPQWMHGLARDPQVVLDWSIEHQQLPLLARSRELREWAVGLRREPMLADANQALKAATATYNEAVFDYWEDEAEVEHLKAQAEQRVQMLKSLYAHEAACSLGRTGIVGVAAVLSAVDAPTRDLVDTRHDIEVAAQELARKHEQAQGRTAKDVSGEHQVYPYDLHSTGAGGVRCIEVKGTTTGQFFMTENERRAAKRLGAAYYLYIVSDPCGSPRLTIIRDPLGKMTHDTTLYSGVRYGFSRSTWQAASDEEIAL